MGWAAWIALIPAFQAVYRSKSVLEAYLIFFAIGFLFYFVSIEWLRHVTYFGWIFVTVALASYFGVYGALARYFLKGKRTVLALIALPALWVVLEWIRTEIPDWGFGWNLLGYSQSICLPIAGLASWVGVYGVSFSHPSSKQRAYPSHLKYRLNPNR